jgi:3-oxoacyl-[acyl-carrier protein] reductase
VSGEGRTVALVTGASRGLGRAMAVKIAQPGTHVIIHYHHEISQARETAELAEARGATTTLLSADLGEAGEVEALVQDIRMLDLPIDILVNNAGAVTRPASWLEQSDDDLVRTINLNLLAPMRLIRMFAPDMIKRGAGQIINVTSTYALTGAAAVLGYSVAKAGLITLTRAMARELAPHGIRVNAIAPGNFDTDMTSSAGPDTVSWIISTTPLGRLGIPSEVADALQYLLEAKFITGQVLIIDGGQLLQI